MSFCRFTLPRPECKMSCGSCVASCVLMSGSIKTWEKRLGEMARRAFKISRTRERTRKTGKKHVRCNRPVD